jgi:hypothetical protein
MVQKFLIQAMLCIAVLLGYAASSEAAFWVSVTIGATTETVYDGQTAGNANADGSYDFVPKGLPLGKIDTEFNFGGYVVDVTATSNYLSAQAIQTGKVSDVTGSIIRNAGSASQVIITTSSAPGVVSGSPDAGFSIAQVGEQVTVLSAVSGSSLAFGPGGGNVTMTSQVDGTTTSPLVLTGPAGPAPTYQTVTLSASPFAIGNTLVANNLAPDGSSFTFSASTTVTVPVPPALALLASGLPFGLVFFRRRKKA